MDNSAASFAMLNNLRTGNQAVDMALAMLVPGIMTAIYTFMNGSLKPFLFDFYDKFFNSKSTNMYIRRVEFEKIVSGYGQLSGRDERNNILQKALTLYIGETAGAKNYKVANVSLLAAKEKGIRDESTWDMNYGSTADQLKRYQVTTVPPKDEWVKVSDGIEFKEVEEKDDSSDSENKKERSVEKSTTLFMFRSERSDAGSRIDDYLQAAFHWYTKQVGQEIDPQRYMYMLVNKEHVLPRQGKFVAPLGNFTEKKGKYSIAGYPDKLGLLLYGPPGTGKTSLIKALASQTNRSIVNVSLAKIKTNQELMDIFFDQKFKVSGEELPVKLKFKDTIFVLEDIDAASKIVHKRSLGKVKKKFHPTTIVKTTTTIETPPPDENSEVVLTSPPPSLSRGTTVEEVITTTKQCCDDNATSSPLPSPLPSPSPKESVFITRSVTVDNNNTNNEDECSEDEGEPTSEDKVMNAIATMLGATNSVQDDDDPDAAMVPKAFISSKDKLDLSGLLNVLDGVVDTPDRIVVMTSNHPEKLDPALIRPGRIDKKIHLGFLVADSACSMCEHYFEGKLTQSQREVLDEVLRINKSVTPACFEQFCAEHDTLSDFIDSSVAYFMPIKFQNR